MPNLDINAFRTAVSNAQTGSVYLRLSHHHHTLEGRGPSFLERKFGWHLPHLGTSYKNTRLALYNALRNSGQYQTDTLQDIATALGIVGGKSTIKTKLSLRDVRHILDIADKAAPVLDDRPLNQQLPAQFHTHMQQRLQKSLTAATPFQNPTAPADYTNAFTNLRRDYRRGGFAISLNQATKIHGDTTLSDAQANTLENDLAAFFRQDQAHGRMAASIINDFAHQDLYAMVGDYLTGDQAEPLGNLLGFPQVISNHGSFDFSRQPDGSYKVTCSYEYTPVQMLAPDGNNPAAPPKFINLQAGSRLAFNFTVNITFDARNNPSISLENGARVSGHLRQLSQTDSELCDYYSFLGSKPVEYKIGILHEPGLLAELKTPQFKALTKEQQVAYLTDHIINSQPHLNALEGIGLSSDICARLIAHPQTAGFHFDMKFYDRLFSTDQTTRSQAYAELNQELQAQHQANRMSLLQLNPQAPGNPPPAGNPPAATTPAATAPAASSSAATSTASPADDTNAPSSTASPADDTNAPSSTASV